MGGDMGTWVRFCGVIFTGLTTLGTAVLGGRSLAQKVDNLTEVMMNHLSQHDDEPKKGG